MPLISTLRATLLALLLLPIAATAEKNKHSKQFDNYTVHYNTLPTDFLSTTVAKRHKIVRSRNNILVNISVKRTSKDGKTVTVPAKITVQARNRTAQLKYAKMREVLDQKGIYYLGEFRVANREHLFFTVTVTPKDKQASTYSLKFDKTFRTK